MRTDLQINMLQPVNRLDSLNRGLQSRWIALPGTTGGRRFMDIVNPGPNGSHGTLTNMDPATAWKGSSRPGGWGALEFVSASSQYVDLRASTALNISGDITISASIHADSLSSARAIIDHKGVSEQKNKELIINAGKARIGFSKADQEWGAETLLEGSTSLSSGVDYHICGVGKANDYMKIFVNGIEDGTKNITWSFSPGDVEWNIGRRVDGIWYWDGRIDDVCIWDRALTVTEVLDLYHDQRLGSPRTLNRIRRPLSVAAAPTSGKSHTQTRVTRTRRYPQTRM